MGNKTSCGTIRSVIILVINNRTPAADFFIARMITDRIGLQSVLRCSDRCGIGFPSAGAKIKQTIAKHVHMKGFVVIYTCIM